MIGLETLIRTYTQHVNLSGFGFAGPQMEHCQLHL